VLADTLSWAKGRHSLQASAASTAASTTSTSATTAAPSPIRASPTSRPGAAPPSRSRSATSTATSRSRPSGSSCRTTCDLSANFSVELGLRYDRIIAPTEAEDRFVYFDPASSELRQVGVSGRDKIYDDKDNFQPRVGVIWDPFGDGKTSIRAAYSILSDQPVTNVGSRHGRQPADRHAAHVHRAGRVDPAGQRDHGRRPRGARAQQRRRRLPQPDHADLERERAARVLPQHDVHGRLLRLEGRAPAQSRAT
jgi:hypothetical protein